MSLFFTAVDGAVVNALNARKAYYASEDRSVGNKAEQAHTWLFKKMAFVTASAKSQSGKTASLATPTKGGLGKINASGKSSGGLYTGAGKRNKQGDSSSVRFLPKPHIVSFKVYNDGDMGSIKKCELAFTVYSLADIDLMAPFFAIGGDLGVRYGWNQAGAAGGPAGAFQGQVYNFSYSVNSSGGFDCISYGMGKGINILSVNADAPKDAKGESTTDEEFADVINHSNNVIQKIKNDCIALADTVVDSYDATLGISAVKYETDWGSPTDRKEDTKGAAGEPETQYYVSLGRICNLLNELVLEAAGDAFKNIKFICSSGISSGNFCIANNFASTNPTEVIFPGRAKYGDKKEFTFGEIDTTAYNANTVDHSLCMFNVDWLEKEFAKLGKVTVKGQKSADATISSLLKSLFDCVFINSAGFYKLTTILDPADKTGNRVLIIDGSYVDKSITPYEITAVTQSSICRNVSLQSKVPNEMAVIAMVAADTAAGNQNGDVFTAIDGGDASKKGKDVPATSNGANETRDAMIAIGSSGVTAANVKSAQTALKSLILFVYKDAGGGPSTIMPIDFSCTLDGIEGFIFGNAITCNYLPSAYKKLSPKGCFTVLKVEHNISGNDWTTSLSTVFRLVP